MKTDPDIPKPIVYESSEAKRLIDLLVQYYPGDAGWRVLSQHLAEAFVRAEATHFNRTGYDPAPKSKFDRAEDQRVLDAVAAIVAAWPEGPLLPPTSRLQNSRDVIGKLHRLSRGETSRTIENAEAVAEAERQAELSRRANEAAREFLERQ